MNSEYFTISITKTCDMISSKTYENRTQVPSGATNVGTITPALVWEHDEK